MIPDYIWVFTCLENLPYVCKHVPNKVATSPSVTSPNLPLANYDDKVDNVPNKVFSGVLLRNIFYIKFVAVSPLPSLTVRKGMLLEGEGPVVRWSYTGKFKPPFKSLCTTLRVQNCISCNGKDDSEGLPRPNTRSTGPLLRNDVEDPAV